MLRAGPLHTLPSQRSRPCAERGAHFLGSHQGDSADMFLQGTGRGLRETQAPFPEGPPFLNFLKPGPLSRPTQDRGLWAGCRCGALARSF